MYQHVTYFVSNNGIGLCCWVIKEPSDGLRFALCRFGLFFCDGVDLCEHGIVYSPVILQQYSNNIMEFSFFILVKFRGGVIIWRILYPGSVLRSSPLMINIMLANGWRLLEFVEGFLYVALHLYVYMFYLVIPLNYECRIKFHLPIYWDFIQFLDCLDEMLYMLISNIHDIKVIKNKGAGYGYGFVVPE